MLADLDGGLQAVFVVKEQDISEVAFGESLCGRCVNALGLAGETQRNKVLLVEIGIAANFLRLARAGVKRRRLVDP